MDLLVSESTAATNASDAAATVAPGTACVRDLTPDEIAALDAETVAKNNSASLEELMKNHTSTRD